MAAGSDCFKRLQREYKQLTRDPVPHITARPNPQNILEWHYILYGPPDSAYAGGEYHGRLKFPPEYPHKPPSIVMFTPSGRFQPGMRLCLSISDYHPETWNPMWSVGTILTGLLSFMLDDTAIHAGSITASHSDRKRFAAFSRQFNRKNPVFLKLFDDLLSETEKLNISSSVSTSQSSTSAESPPSGQQADAINPTVATPNEQRAQLAHQGGRHNAGSHSSLFLWAMVFAAFGFLIYFIKRGT
jgi:ubiquitin-conjugating enzyme E2 J2